MSNVIHTMRSYFGSNNQDQPVTPPLFAAGILNRKRAIVRQLMQEQGFVPAELLSVLTVRIPAPDAIDPKVAVDAMVAGGHWIAKCPDCGTCEYVDFGWLIFMCTTCWNGAADGKWRNVTVPDAGKKAEIETLLLARPIEVTRSWKPGEPTA